MSSNQIGGQAAIALLEAYGVDTVFGIPGVHTLDLYRGLADRKLRHVGVRHEQGAGFMADGYARASGKPAACCLITGPGLLNAATPIGQAYSDSVPMLVLASVNASDDLGKGRGRLHEITDQHAAIAPLTGLTRTIRSAAELLCERLTNKEIAYRLGITEKTARNHISHILEKLNLSRRTEAAAYAVQKKLVTLPEAGKGHE